MSGCDCGSSCGCGSDCKCGKMYPDLEKATTTAAIITGVAPVKTYSEGSSEGGEGCKSGNGCKCGSNCSCDPCNC